MKRYFILFFVFFMSYPGKAQNTVENRNFENWTDHGNFEDPKQWETVNKSVSTIPGNSRFPVTKITDAYSDFFAVRMKSIHYNFIRLTVPGAVTNGKFTLGTGYTPKFSGGQPFSKRPERITGKFIYQPAGNDTCGFFGLLTRYDTVNNRRDTIAAGNFIYGDTAENYRTLTIKFNYYDSLTPDTLQLIATSSVIDNRPGGSVFILDALKAETSSGLEIPLMKDPAKVYPTPVSSKLYLAGEGSREGSGTVYISLFSITGNRVMARQEIDKYGIPVTGLKKGIYIYHLINKEGEMLKQGKIIKVPE